MEHPFPSWIILSTAQGWMLEASSCKVFRGFNPAPTSPQVGINIYLLYIYMASNWPSSSSLQVGTCSNKLVGRQGDMVTNPRHQCYLNGWTPKTSTGCYSVYHVCQRGALRSPPESWNVTVGVVNPVGNLWKIWWEAWFHLQEFCLSNLPTKKMEPRKLAKFKATVAPAPVPP